VLIGERIVTLCDRHADEVRRSGQTDMDALCRMYQEPGGRRSLVDRRASLDRRVFPPRPEGRRRNAGRRHDDARE
jgi:hypothetical protein